MRETHRQIVGQNEVISKQQGKMLSKVAAAAVLVAAPFTAQYEGLRLEAHLDPVGVVSICYGETQGITWGQKMTKAACDAIYRERLGFFSYVVDYMTSKDLPVKTHAAAVSFAYNIGTGGYSKSRTRQLFDQGKFYEACHAMMGWYRAGGQDCRKPGSKCPGLIIRRKAEVKLCLQGIESSTPST